MQSGAVWGKGYSVIALRRFDGVPLLSDAKHLGAMVTLITVSPDVKLVPGTSSWFPLLERSTYANKTLNGREEHQRLQKEFSDQVEAMYLGGPMPKEINTVVQPEPLVEGDELPEGREPLPDGTDSVIMPPPQPPTDVPDNGGSSGSGGAV